MWCTGERGCHVERKHMTQTGSSPACKRSLQRTARVSVGPAGRGVRATLILCTLTLAASCASVNDPIKKSYTAGELGLAYYYPQARMSIRPVADRKYRASLELGPSRLNSTGQDGLRAVAIEFVATVCPAWRIARIDKAPSARIQQFPPGSGREGFFDFDVLLLDKPTPQSEGYSPAEGRYMVVDFTAPGWQALRSQWCDDPDKLNRSAW
jgi:hypothetical protein